MKVEIPRRQSLLDILPAILQNTRFLSTGAFIDYICTRKNHGARDVSAPARTYERRPREDGGHKQRMDSGTRWNSRAPYCRQRRGRERSGGCGSKEPAGNTSFRSTDGG